jgi:hypothetical protein
MKQNYYVKHPEIFLENSEIMTNAIKVLLQMQSGFLQLESPLCKLGTGCKDTLVICNSAFMALII